MKTTLRLLLSIVAMVLIGNFIILRLYGDTLQSSNLFIVRGTVFYPFAFLNGILGVALGAYIFLDWRKSRSES
ncbi:hypothetical protein [Dehalogenimonas etheniformans]|uniref:Uncharacterized protein n=1 Tax=Dehalogenimonas etheniformans TaxID=1536648 RepID=A0A2P5P853_9CHLR|nr:hypothetical protein [Dehalogenimonas etheniformans]PPD58482.1 hypothetical protein JP09_000920 [Dehalogenimonas etheniformans]QNT76754.1 hypothetical protein HX448_08700 [Dehalogenimonas etheniformans]